MLPYLSDKKGLFLRMSAASVFFTSFNESIPKDFVDHVVHLLSQFARGPLEGKTDIEDAFRIIPIHPSCYRVFGFSLKTSATIVVCLWGVLNG